MDAKLAAAMAGVPSPSSRADHVTHTLLTQPDGYNTMTLSLMDVELTRGPHGGVYLKLGDGDARYIDEPEELLGLVELLIGGMGFMALYAAGDPRCVRWEGEVPLTPPAQTKAEPIIPDPAPAAMPWDDDVRPVVPPGARK